MKNFKNHFLISLILIPFALNISCSNRNKENSSLSIISPINIVTSSYRTLLNRDPDKNGLFYFQELLKQGMNKEEIEQIIMNSEEYKVKESYKKIVKNVYRRLLNREPDESGFTHYQSLLINGVTPSEIEEIIMDSEEYKVKESYKKIVKNAYKKLLNREPDESGLTYYQNLLINGSTPFEIEKMIRNSEEYNSI